MNPLKFVKAFGMFWWDFIVGDSITLAIGGALAIVLAYAISRISSAGVVEVGLPGVVLGTLVLSLRGLK